MCGIAGYAGQHGSREILQKMAEAIRRRGPDDEGFYESDSVGFAFRRLSIIDLAGGHQPLANEDGTVWVMLNGEIYNFAALRDELMRAGHVFKTKSDTEVIAHGYEEWGDRVFEKISGMFAIAIWDAKQSRLILARDRLGKKPLYWTETKGTLWFASEVKALLAAKIIAKEIDLESLALYFRTDAVPTPHSIFKSIFKLEPASALAWSDGRIEKKWTYWSAPQERRDSITPNEAVNGLRERIDQAVRGRLVADVPLGLFLSGGLDSAVIAESAARQSSLPMKSFTIGFDDASHDERDAARVVANALGFDHHEEVLTTESALGMLDEATEVLDEPLADAAILPQLLLARFTRRHVTVALSGDGGDELLLGYQHIPAHVMMEKLRRVPFALRSLVERMLERIPAGSGYFSFGFKAQRLARGLTSPNMWARDLAWRGSFTAADLSNLLLPNVLPAINTHEAEDDLARRAGETRVPDDLWRSWTWAYLRTYLMDDVLVKVDRATMWFSLEARAPLLDEDVVSFLLSVSDRFKLGAWKNKRLFKELLHGRLPSNILNRPKHGFGVPVSAWLKGPLKEQLMAFAEPSFIGKQGLFRHETVKRLIDEHLAGRTDRRRELWAYLMFQRWWERWMK